MSLNIAFHTMNTIQSRVPFHLFPPPSITSLLAIFQPHLSVWPRFASRYVVSHSSLKHRTLPLAIFTEHIVNCKKIFKRLVWCKWLIKHSKGSAKLQITATLQINIGQSNGRVCKRIIEFEMLNWDKLACIRRKKE